MEWCIIVCACVCQVIHHNSGSQTRPPCGAGRANSILECVPAPVHCFNLPRDDDVAKATRNVVHDLFGDGTGLTVVVQAVQIMGAVDSFEETQNLIRCPVNTDSILYYREGLFFSRDKEIV